MTTPIHHNFSVQEEESGQRLDQFLLSKLPGYTRNYIQKLISDGHVSSDRRKTAKKNATVHEGDKISLTIPQAVDLKLEAEELPLDILYEDDDFLIINKQAGLVVHPASDQLHHQSGTLVNALLAHCKTSLSGIGGVKRPGIVHRLDKDTSGIMICTKNDFAHQYFSKLFLERTIKKTYLALVKGHMKVKSGKIDAPIGRSSVNRIKMDISAQGRPAVTNFDLEKEYKNCSLIRVHIETGRTHQIRVHLASIGHPIVGDPSYGEKKLNQEFKSKYQLERQFLHAFSLTFKMPRSQEEQSFTAKLPPDLNGVINKLS